MATRGRLGGLHALSLTNDSLLVIIVRRIVRRTIARWLGCPCFLLPSVVLVVLVVIIATRRDFWT